MHGFGGGTRSLRAGGDMRIIAILAIAAALFLSACSKPLASGHVARSIEYFSNDYATSPNDAYYAVRWALKNAGYPVEKEDLPGGIITSKWLPVTADSHYMEIFGRQDYGATNSYYQLEVHITPGSGRTLVKVGSRAKTLAHNLKSSGVEERKVLAFVGDYLRSSEPNLTNLGLQE